MPRRAARCLPAGLAALVCAIPSPAPAISERPTERGGEVWAPALAAWGARAAAPRLEVGHAPALGASALAPTLVTVGQEAAGALADAPAPAWDETQRWVPGFAFQSGLLGQKAEGSVDANSTVTYEYVVRQRPNNNEVNPVGHLVVTRSLREGKTNYFSFQAGQPVAFTPGTRPNNIGPSSPPNPPQAPPPVSPAPGCATNPNCSGGFVLPQSGVNHLLSPFVGLATEIMTPGLQEAPGRPRLFLHSDAQLAFSQVRSVGREGVPEGVSFPPIDETDVPVEAEVSGVGSVTNAEVKTLLVSGGLGVAFTVDAWERRLRIKPSFEYLREKIEVTGKLVRAFRQDTGLAKLPPGNLPAVYLPPIELDSKDELTAWGIGPGLELEMDAGRAGPFMLSVFLAGQAYRMLGDRGLELQDTAQIEVPDANPNTPAVQDVSAEWDFHLHAWSYRGGLGVRFRWLPEGR